jgi:hypothetical protein
MDPVTYRPEQVIPAGLARVVNELPYWFVIGGHAVRCLVPYRPSRDVDFGVSTPAELDDLLAALDRSGHVVISEHRPDTAHLLWNGILVSVFVLPLLQPFVEGRRLNATGILATKLHAILDRGTRRDFFDLYVTLRYHHVGILECLTALRQVYRQDVNEGLLLRALTYFDDADREAPLAGEGRHDWERVKDYFLVNAGSLLVPPGAALDIQANTVDVTEGPQSGNT